jgi:hypothetical protein
MKLLARLNSRLNHSAHNLREAVHLPWSAHEGTFAPSGSLVVAVALASVAAAIVMATA